MARRLVRQAIAEGWEVPQRIRDQIAARAVEYLDADRKRKRMLVAALRVSLAMETQNVAAGSDLWATHVNYDQLPTS